MSMLCSFRKLWKDLKDQSKDEEKRWEDNELKETVEGTKEHEEECVA